MNFCKPSHLLSIINGGKFEFRAEDKKDFRKCVVWNIISVKYLHVIILNVSKNTCAKLHSFLLGKCFTFLDFL